MTSWPIFHGLLTSDLGNKKICGSVPYISWSSDSVLNREDYLMGKCCTGDAQGRRRGHPCISDTSAILIFDILCIIIHYRVTTKEKVTEMIRVQVYDIILPLNCAWAKLAASLELDNICIPSISSSRVGVLLLTGTCTTLLDCNKMSHVTRKPVFGVSDQVRLKPACSAAEAS